MAIGLHIPLKHALAASGEAIHCFEPNAFIEVTSDNLVTVIVKHIEFGQGPLTGLATLVAEEMDADWSLVRAKLAPANAALYAHTWAPMQFTGGSTAIANSYTQMRKAGATARAMLVRAAAERWGVAANTLQTRAEILNRIDVPPLPSSAELDSIDFGFRLGASAMLMLPIVFFLGFSYGAAHLLGDIWSWASRLPFWV